ncbi:phospholipid scramblase 3-like [Discoglossus pictus]
MSDCKDPCNSDKPVQNQPQRQSEIGTDHPNQLFIPTAVVPLGLEPLVEVEEVILKKTVFQTRSGQILFSIHNKSKCCGPPLNIWLRDSKKRNVIKVYMTSHGACCADYLDLQIDVPYKHPIGFAKLSNTTGTPKFSIQNARQESVFTAVCTGPIQIISVKENIQVAQIKKEHGCAEIVFQFPMDMEAKMKAVILGTFLYANYRLQRIFRQQVSPMDNDIGWIFGSVLFWSSVGGGDCDKSNDDCGCCGGDHDDNGNCEDCCGCEDGGDCGVCDDCGDCCVFFD